MTKIERFYYFLYPCFDRRDHSQIVYDAQAVVSSEVVSVVVRFVRIVEVYLQCWSYCKT